MWLTDDIAMVPQHLRHQFLTDQMYIRWLSSHARFLLQKRELKMTVCALCGKDMDKVDDCSENRNIEYPDGKILPASTFHFDEQDGHCHDCNIKHGNYHHPGCDVERCPRCKGQVISCDCFDDL